MSLRKACILILGVLPALSACSQSLDAKACLHGGRLAFDFEHVSSWTWGKKTYPRVRYIWVGDVDAGYVGPGGGLKATWQAYAPERPQKPRHILLYGQALEGWNVTKRPERLRRGRRYILIVQAGRPTSVDKFTYDERLPACR